MTRRRLFLHIGFAKTGTTTLQVMLQRNRRSFERAGYLYPSARNASYMQRSQHSPVRVATTKRPYPWLWPEKAAQLDRVMDDFNAVVAKSSAPNVVVSSESFGAPNLGKTALRNVREAFAGFDITVVAYVRQTDEYLLSVLYQAFRSGRTRPVDDADLALPALNFGTILDRWRDEFGAENVSVRPFGRDLLHNGDLVDDFLHTLGIGLSRDDLLLPGALHGSISVQGLSVVLAYNRYREALGAARVSRAAIEKRQRLISSLAAREQGGVHQKLSLSSAHRNRLREAYREENARALAGSGIDVDVFFPEVPDGVIDNTREIERFYVALYSGILCDLVAYALPASMARRGEAPALSARPAAFLRWYEAAASTHDSAHDRARAEAGISRVAALLAEIDADVAEKGLPELPGDGLDLGVAMAVLDRLLDAAVARDGHRHWRKAVRAGGHRIAAIGRQQLRRLGL